MSTPENSFSLRERLGMTASLMLRRRVLAGIAAMLMGASLVFTWSASAHDIDVAQAKQKIEDYARRVLKERNYVNYQTDCKKLYPHQVSCWAGYMTEASRKAEGRERYACNENITIYFKSHSGNRRDWTYYMTHVSRYPCGNEKLKGPNP